eukprot:g8710.t1
MGSNTQKRERPETAEPEAEEDVEVVNPEPPQETQRENIPTEEVMCPGCGANLVTGPIVCPACNTNIAGTPKVKQSLISKRRELLKRLGYDHLNADTIERLGGQSKQFREGSGRGMRSPEGDFVETARKQVKRAIGLGYTSMADRYENDVTFIERMTEHGITLQDIQLRDIAGHGHLPMPPRTKTQVDYGIGLKTAHDMEFAKLMYIDEDISSITDSDRALNDRFDDPHWAVIWGRDLYSLKEFQELCERRHQRGKTTKLLTFTCVMEATETPTMRELHQSIDSSLPVAEQLVLPNRSAARVCTELRPGDELVEVNGTDVTELEQGDIEPMFEARPLKLLFRRRPEPSKERGRGALRGWMKGGGALEAVVTRGEKQEEGMRVVGNIRIEQVQKVAAYGDPAQYLECFNLAVLVIHNLAVEAKNLELLHSEPRILRVLLEVMPADATSPSLRRLIFSTLTCLCQEKAVSGRIFHAMAEYFQNCQKTDSSLHKYIMCCANLYYTSMSREEVKPDRGMLMFVSRMSAEDDALVARRALIEIFHGMSQAPSELRRKFLSREILVLACSYLENPSPEIQIRAYVAWMDFCFGEGSEVAADLIAGLLQSSISGNLWTRWRGLGVGERLVGWFKVHGKKILESRMDAAQRLSAAESLDAMLHMVLFAVEVDSSMVVALVAEDVLGCIAHRLEDVLAASDGLGTGGSAGADQDAVARAGYTALHLASECGQQNAVDVLLQAGADIDAATAEGYTALHLAARQGQQNVVDVLLQAGADIEVAAKDFGCAGCRALHLAAGSGHLNVVDMLFQAGADKHAATKRGYTALHWASLCGRQTVVDVLLQAGADKDAAIKTGKTALHLAAQCGQQNVVDVLLQAGVDMEAATKEGYTALHLASERGWQNVVDVLLQAGADKDAATEEGYTALHLASKYRQQNVVDVLLQAGADQDAAMSALNLETPLVALLELPTATLRVPVMLVLCAMSSNQASCQVLMKSEKFLGVLRRMEKKLGTVGEAPPVKDEVEYLVRLRYIMAVSSCLSLGRSEKAEKAAVRRRLIQEVKESLAAHPALAPLVEHFSRTILCEAVSVSRTCCHGAYEQPLG